MSCCVCFNEIQELSNWEYQCQTCTDGIICYTCFHNVTNRRRYNLLRNTTTKTDNQENVQDESQNNIRNRFL